jgi:adhesin transport system membrane fusion protein
MNPLDALLEQHGRLGLRGWPWLIMAVIAAFLVWAYFADIEQVVVATGEVSPQGRVKVIQHLEGGIIEAFHVVEGDRVNAGDALVSLNLVTAGLNRDEIQTLLDARLLVRARLAAEASGEALAFADALSTQHPDLAAAEQAVFSARRAELASELGVLSEQLNRLSHKLDESTTQQGALEANLALVREELAMLKSLFEEELIAELKVLNAQKTETRLAGELEVHKQTRKTHIARNTETQALIAHAEARFRRRAREESARNEAEIAGLSERLSVASEQQRRATIRSPIEGEVKNLRYHTIGGVVAPRDPILQIVPVADQLVIEARLLPADRGLVRDGLPVTVKITAYDFVRYGGLDGTVSHLAPDTSEESGEPFYRLVITTEKGFLGPDPDQNQITPGMGAVVDIRVGAQSVLDFLLQPVLKMADEAFREP